MKHKQSPFRIGSVYILMHSFRWSLLLVMAFGIFPTLQAQQRRTEQPWTEAQANAWYAQQPWPVGADFLPSTAINELEMWQADTFDPATIDRELGWAEGIGMNTMRVFLHNLLWEQDPKGFQQRIDAFLAIAARHHIRPVFVLFDSCWDPHPKLGPQHPPIPGVHNSGWVQAPGQLRFLPTPRNIRALKATSKEWSAHSPTIRAFWPGICGTSLTTATPTPTPTATRRTRTKSSRSTAAGLRLGPYRPSHATTHQRPLARRLDLPRRQCHRWPASRSSNLTSSAFTTTAGLKTSKQHVKLLEQFHRPIICTEYMARNIGSTFDTILPIAKQHHVGAINWGLVAGKSQTWIPWDSWQRPYVNEQPAVWQHDVFHPDGTPYRQREVEIIRSLTSAERFP